VTEHGRHHLDLRHPAVVKFLDETVDFLVADLGIGYLKLDYNIRIDPGTEANGESAGAGLLGHNRALLGWLDRVMDRHPGLTIENCASGGMRADYAMLSRLQLQSTSDQQDPLRYPAIAAAAMAAVTPEQAGIWAYPQSAYSQEQNAIT
jgi:alpha-galactosidase